MPHTVRHAWPPLRGRTDRLARGDLERSLRTPARLSPVSHSALPGFVLPAKHPANLSHYGLKRDASPPHESAHRVLHHPRRGKAIEVALATVLVLEAETHHHLGYLR